MRGAHPSFLAARREVTERLGSRAWRISTVVQIVAVIGVVILFSVIGGDGPTETDTGVFARPGERIVKLADQAGARLEYEFKVHRYPDRASARAAIADGEIDVAVGTGRMLVSPDVDQTAEAILGQAQGELRLKQSLARAGLDPGQIGTVTAAISPTAETVSGKSDDGGTGIAWVAVLLLYIALIFSGYAVSSGVIEEKSSRVVELIIIAVKPRQLLAGKVVGIGLMGLLQLALIVVAGLATALALGDLDLPSSTLSTALLALLYFILGFALYGCGFAVAGSLVSRQEDSQASTAPVMIILVVAYLFSISALNDASSTMSVIGTLVPFLAPMVVPARAAAGALPPEQLILSVVLMLATSAALIALAGKVYEAAVLRTGSPITPRQMVALLRSER